VNECKPLILGLVGWIGWVGISLKAAGLTSAGEAVSYLADTTQAAIGNVGAGRGRLAAGRLLTATRSAAAAGGGALATGGGGVVQVGTRSFLSSIFPARREHFLRNTLGGFSGYQ
jgi:hypothetical protein